MEKLTTTPLILSGKHTNDIDTFKSAYNIMLDKLKEYEDLEEQGLLKRLPCKIGDTLYDIGEYFIGRASPEIYGIVAKDITITKDNDEEDLFIIDSCIYKKSDFGKTLFSTIEEAKRAVEGLKIANKATN